MSAPQDQSAKLPTASGSNEDGAVVGYMCIIDWEHELGSASDGNRVFPSVDALRRKHPCVDACGIVEVEVRCRKLIAPGKEDNDEQ